MIDTLDSSMIPCCMCGQSPDAMNKTSDEILSGRGSGGPTPRTSIVSAKEKHFVTKREPIWEGMLKDLAFRGNNCLPATLFVELTCYFSHLKFQKLYHHIIEFIIEDHCNTQESIEYV